MTAPADPVAGLRPSVALPARGAGPWAIGAIVLLAGVLLFWALESRRSARAAPAVIAPRDSLALAPPPEVPPLLLPGSTFPQIAIPTPRPAPAVLVSTRPQTLTPTPQVAVPARQRRGEALPAPPDTPPIYTTQPPAYTPPQSAPPPYAPQPGVAPPTQRSPAQPGTRGGPATVEAARIANLPFIVLQGTLIQAVLETALDSNHAGAARALVTQDVYGFDGARVLIPRGSRLYGDYRAELAPGQNRALVVWSRLVRPDGVSVALDSPSADALGRAGIRGKVDSHFLERFGAALLQTTLDVGVNAAARGATGNTGVVVALPGGSVSAPPLVDRERFRRTIRVAQGAKVAVFVARDLDFAAVDGAPVP